MTAQPKILAIDTDPDVCSLLASVAEAKNLRHDETSDTMSFLKHLDAETTLVLIELEMPNMDGIQLLRFMARQRQFHVDIVLMSKLSRRILEAGEEAAKALGLSVVGLLEKPFWGTELNEVFERHLSAEDNAVARLKETMLFEDDELRRAVERDEFVLHYQPQIDIATRCLSGVEALVRWQRPGGPLLYPDSFIGRAEELEIIQQLDWLVLQRACSEISRMRREGISIPSFSVNVSVSSFCDLRYPDRVMELLKEHEIAPHELVIEITESGAIGKMACTLDVLTRLRIKGIGLSVDDFGTGYSTMQQLRNIPATEIKIDRAFVNEMLRSDSDRIMVLKTIELGHALDMRVVAEGVETADQYRFLSKLGCDIAQGYLSHPPVSASKLGEWIRNYRVKSSERMGPFGADHQATPQMA